MAPDVAAVLASAEQLSPADRRELIDRLAAGLDDDAGNDGPPIPEPTEDAWLAELNRRSDEIDAGTAKLAPWNEVKARVRQQLDPGEARGGSS